MHGRKKSEYKAKQQDPVISSALVKKARQYNTLCDEIISLKNRESIEDVSSSKSEAETIPILEKLLLVNPDPNYLWNYRREILLKNHKENEGDSGIYQKELNLTVSCLKRNPKAYAVWTYRKWIIHDWVLSSKEKLHEEKVESRILLLENELKLCADFLALDERNFHCWNYRRFVVSALSSVLSSNGTSSIPDFDGSWKFITREDSNIMGPQIGIEPKSDEIRVQCNDKINQLMLKEWDFTTTKIQTNFSNYSAFHYRSKLFPFKIQNQLKDSECNYQNILELMQEEIDLLNSAVFTEPDDQTAWWYYRFIINWMAPTSSSMKSFFKEENDDCESYVNFLEEQCYASIQELVEDEQCKWGLLGLHSILDVMVKHCHDDNKKQQWRDEAKECLKKLLIIDSDRCKRYEHMLRRQT